MRRQRPLGRLAGQAGHQLPGEEVPQVIPLRQHVLAQVRLRHAVGEHVQPPALHPADVGGEGLLPGDHGAHAPADGQALAVELGLVVRHDPHWAVRVEVPRHLREREAEQGQLLHGEGEQVLVVGLEVDLAPHFQHLAVQPQEVAVGQAALGVAAAGPGVAEVDVDPVRLAGGEEEGQLVGVGVDEIHIGEPGGHAPLHGHDHGVRHPFHGDEQHVRLRRRRPGGEAALAAAQLHPQLPGLGHQLPPFAGHGIGVPDQAVAAALHPGDQVLFLSHPHCAYPPGIGPRSEFMGMSRGRPSPVRRPSGGRGASGRSRLILPYPGACVNAGTAVFAGSGDSPRRRARGASAAPC